MDGAILIHEILSNHLIVLTKIGIALKKVYILWTAAYQN